VAVGLALALFLVPGARLLLRTAPTSGPTPPESGSPASDQAPISAASVHGRLLGPNDLALSGGRVTAWPERDPADRHETTTDAAGAFSLAGLTEERWVIAATASGYSEARGVRALPLEAPLDLRVVRVARVAGQILGVDGLPASADVVIVGSGIWPARTVRADADGHFAFENVPPGVYEVEARGALSSEPRRGLVVEQGARLLLTLTLTPGAILAGTVVDDATGAPIADAEIVVASEALSSTPRTTRSDATGAFRIAGLREGETERVSARAEGFVPLVAERWDGGPMALRLTHAGTVSGVVLDEQRRPVEGAQIEVWGESAIGQPIAVTAASHGMQGALFRDETATFGDPGRLDVTSDVPPIPIDAIAGGPSLAAIDAPPTPVVSSASYRTAADGTFEIPGVAPGHVQVTARAPGLATGTSERVYVGPGAARGEVELVLAPAGHVTGVVQDERGDGVADVLVEVRSDRDPSPAIAFTDAYGRFSMDATGTVVVRALPVDRPPTDTRLTVASGAEREVMLALDPAGLAIAGQVVDARGFPIEGVQLRIEALRPGSAILRTAFSGEDGRFELTSVPAPPLRITADHTSYAVGTSIDAASLDEVSIVLAPALRAAGSVVDAWTAEPITGARVVLVSEGLPPVVREGVTRDDGQFYVPRLGEGAYSLRIEAAGHVAYEGRVVAHAGRSSDVEIDEIAMEPGQRIEGDVVDHLGSVAQGATVEVEGLDVVTRTDEHGHFALEAIPAGEIVLAVRHASAGELRLGRDVVRGRDDVGVRVHLPGRLDDAPLASGAARTRSIALVLDDDRSVSQVIRGSTAERVGIRAGDVVVSVDAEDVTSAAAARAGFAGPPGPALLTLTRDGEAYVVRVERELVSAADGS
jgi:protocatechuate 3,4-dioxygenase beta subunit